MAQAAGQLAGRPLPQKGLTTRVIQRCLPKDVFLRTEELWHRQFEAFERVCFVLLLEAPLFGDKETYFYNPAASLTPFFFYEDIRADPGNFKSQREKKEGLHHCLRQLGIIILDLFPYALNERWAALTDNSFSKGDCLGLLSGSLTLSGTKTRENQG